MEKLLGLPAFLLAALLIALGVYWLILPVMLVRRLDKILAAMDANAKKIEKAIAQLVSSNSPAAAAPIPPGLERYWIANEKEAVGPHGMDTLKQLLQRGTITPDTMVMREGDRNWVRLSSVSAI